MAGTSLVPFNSTLVKPNAILDVIKEVEILPELALDDYSKERARWAAGDTAGDRAVIAALNAAEEGRTLVDISEVIARGGASSKYSVVKVPALTLAPPFAKEVTMRIWHDGEMVLRAGRWKLRLEAGFTFDRKEAISHTGKATVPGMPPEIRKVARKDHLMLWEPEWRKVNSQIPKPPRDPALLERLNGNLYVVVATWDLSPLEAAALA